MVESPTATKRPLAKVTSEKVPPVPTTPLCWAPLRQVLPPSEVAAQDPPRPTATKTPSPKAICSRRPRAPTGPLVISSQVYPSADFQKLLETAIHMPLP